MFHAHTKRIEVDYHFVREKVLQKALEVRNVPTQFPLADMFTKGPTKAAISTIQAPCV